MLHTRTAFLISVALGVALEVGTLGSTTGLPLAVLASVAIGFFSLRRAWMTPVAIGPAEFGAALYRGASLADDWLGPFVYYLGLGVAMLLAALIGRRLRHRFARA